MSQEGMSSESSPYWCHSCEAEVNVITRDREVVCSQCELSFIEPLDSGETFANEHRQSSAETNIPQEGDTNTRETAGSSGSRTFGEGSAPNATASGEQEGLPSQQFASGIAVAVGRLLRGILRTQDNSWGLNSASPVRVHFHTSGAMDAVSDAGFEQLLNRLFERSAAQGPPPCSKKFLDKLRSSVRPVSKAEIEESAECAVCKDVFKLDESPEGEESSKVIELDCSHKFCTDCIIPWLERHNTCPVCRTEFESATSERQASAANDTELSDVVD